MLAVALIVGWLNDSAVTNAEETTARDISSWNEDSAYRAGDKDALMAYLVVAWDISWPRDCAAGTSRFVEAWRGMELRLCLWCQGCDRNERQGAHS